MKILIVEDDVDTRNYVVEKLEQKGHCIDQADNGRRGLFLAKSGNYDVILLDYGLPEQNGFEVCKTLRREHVHTPIIMISVTDEVPTTVEALGLGADDFVTKPFFFDELYARIQTVTRRPITSTFGNIMVNDLTIDIGRQCLFRGNKPIHLTKKEFLLIEYLARHSGDVISRGMITEHVWDSEIDPSSNTIETHILNLRKKIDSGRGDSVIQNVPGRGYRMSTHH